MINIHATQNWVKQQLDNLSSSIKGDIDKSIEDLVNGAPETLDTLEEIANALGENKNAATEMLELIGKKVDKEDGKGLSTEDFTTAEKNKLAGLENYDDEQVVKNAENIDLIDKYGTTDVYVLQEGVDFVTDETGTEIIGTVNGEEGPWIDGVVILPEGITSIGGFDYYLLHCDKLVCLSGLMSHVSNIGAQNFVFSVGCRNLWLRSNPTASYPQKVILDYSQNIFNVRGYDVFGEIIFPLGVLVSNPTIKFGRFEGSLRCMEPRLDFSNIQLFQNNDENVPAIKIYGYAGSTAEAFAKENGYNFVNMGSDYSIPINASTATSTTIYPNEYYSFTGISSLTVTLDTASTTKLDEFMFSFETPSDISAFSFGVLTDESVEIKWVKEPNLKPDYVYEVSVVNGVGVIAGTAKEVTE